MPIGYRQQLLRDLLWRPRLPSLPLLQGLRVVLRSSSSGLQLWASKLQRLLWRPGSGFAISSSLGNARAESNARACPSMRSRDQRWTGVWFPAPWRGELQDQSQGLRGPWCSGVTRGQPKPPCFATIGGPALMADLFAGPNVPLTKAFIFCGWRTVSGLVAGPNTRFEQPWETVILGHSIEGGILHSRSFGLQRQKSCAWDSSGVFWWETCTEATALTPLPRGLAGVDRSGQGKGRARQHGLRLCVGAAPAEGGASVRENPWNSLRWSQPMEVSMWKSGQWDDTCYSACCFGGARSKLQRLRRNVEEIKAWPRAMCNHLHHPKEWEPWEESGKRVYPSHEEAEDTAELCFAIAVAASWWCARVGIARLKVPRAPSPSCSGRRDHWLDIDPRALREWAWPLHWGWSCWREITSSPGRPSQRCRKLPPHHVFVGHGRHSHRLPTTIWKSPLYCQHIRCNLWDKLRTLAGMTLVCDCTSPNMCEADLLAGLVFDSISLSYASAAGQTVPFRRGSNTGSAMRLVSLSAQLSPGFGLKFPFMSQEMVVLAFRRLFPEPWFANFKFPMIEDVINQAPFDSYMRWRLGQELSVEGGFGPHLAAGGVRQLQRAAEGQQVGACARKAALPPLLRYGLDPDEHFAAALAIGEAPLPILRCCQ